MEKHKKSNKIESGKEQAVKMHVNTEKQSIKREIQKLAEELGRAARERKGKKQPLQVIRVGFYVGIDLGDKDSNYCFLDGEAKIVAEGKLATTQAEMVALFSALPKCRSAVEVGTHSPWVSALLESYGHEVFVANPRRMESIHKNKRKNDKVDARTLARLVRADPEVLYPIQHRGVEARHDLVLLRARDAVVAVRTKPINCGRGRVKPVGGRLAKCSAESFHKAVEGSLPESVRCSLLPLVEQIGEMTARIRQFDAEVRRMTEKKYAETGGLQQVKGVGPVTSLCYVLTLESPERFRKSRDVGPYVGLVPQQDDSGESSKQLRITKTGDRMLRQLLVGSAHYILGPFGEDCDLRRFGLKLAARGGKNAKKRAVVAVARKLAVLLHRLWLTGEAYEPLRQNSNLQEEALAIAANE